MAWHWVGKQQLIHRLGFGLSALITGLMLALVWIGPEPLARLAAERVLEHGDDAITLSRDGLLRVDSLLHEFFLPRHRTARFV